VFVVELPQKPKLALCPTAIVALYSSGVALKAPPLTVVAALQAFPNVESPRETITVHPVMGAVPVLVI
jgi:hypothetical protein